MDYAAQKAIIQLTKIKLLETKQLFEAVNNNNIDDFKKLLPTLNIEDIAQQDESGNTIIHHAAKNGYDQILSLILDKISVIEHPYLHNFYKLVNRINNEKQTPLHLAVLNQRNISILKLIKNGKADLYAYDQYGYNIFYYSIETKTAVILAYCIISGPEADIKNNMNSLSNRDSSLTGRIFDYNNQDNEGNTIVHYAAMDDNQAAIELLKQIKTNFFIKKVLKTTYQELRLLNPMDLQMKFQSYEHLKLNELNNRGLSPIHYAGINVTNYLVKAEIDINTQTANDQITVVHYAVRKGDIDLLKYCIDHGAQLDARDNQGRGIIHYAAYFEQFEIIQYLVKYSEISLNQRDKFGNTALHYVTRNDKKNMLDLLVKLRVDLNCKNIQEKTALDLAKEYNQQEIIELLELATKTQDIQSTNWQDKILNNNLVKDKMR